MKEECRQVVNMMSVDASSTQTTYEWDPSQERVIEDVNPCGVIMVKAVPGAGKTQLLIEKCFDSKNSLVISLTNAVRTEIANRIKETFRLRGEEACYTYEQTPGNHDVFVYDDGQPGNSDCVIHVATLDSWVHDCIKELTSMAMMATGAPSVVLPEDNDHTLKKMFLFNQYFSRGVFPRVCLLDYTQIIVDEMQDLDDSFYCILVRIAELALAPGAYMRLILAGDPNQNVFGRADYCVMKAFVEDMRYASKSSSFGQFREYFLEYNHRCPPRHLDFVNKLFQKIGHPSSRKIRWPPTKKSGYKPVLVKTNHGNNANSVVRRAETIVEYIDLLLKDDDEQKNTKQKKSRYTFGDIALLSPRNYSNNLFGVLEGMLRARYGIDKVKWIYSSTAEAGAEEADRTTISSSAWDDIGDSIVLSSIHNNKGKTHRVVFACDCFTDGLMPRHFADSPIEVESQLCQLNVALTRATERLYVFYNDPVSRFVGGEQGLRSLTKYAHFHFSDTCEKWASIAAKLEEAPTFNPSNVMENMNSTTLPRNVVSALRYCYDKGLLTSVDIATSVHRAFVAATGGRFKFICAASTANTQTADAFSSLLWQQPNENEGEKEDDKEAVQAPPLSPSSSSSSWCEVIMKERLANEYFTYMRLFMCHIVLGIRLTSSVTKFSKVLVAPPCLGNAVYLFNRIAASWSACYKECDLDSVVESVAKEATAANNSLRETYKEHKAALIRFLVEEGILHSSSSTASQDEKGRCDVMKVLVDPGCVIMLKSNEASKIHALLSNSILSLNQFLNNNNTSSKPEFQLQHLTNLWNVAVALVNFPNGVCNKRIHTETFVDAPPFPLLCPEMVAVYNECFAARRLFEDRIGSMYSGASIEFSNSFDSSFAPYYQSLSSQQQTFRCSVNPLLLVEEEKDEIIMGEEEEIKKIKDTDVTFSVSVDAVAIVQPMQILSSSSLTNDLPSSCGCTTPQKLQQHQQKRSVVLVPLVFNYALPNAMPSSYSTSLNEKKNNENEAMLMCELSSESSNESIWETDCVLNGGLSGGNPLQETSTGGPSYKDVFQSLLFCWSAAGEKTPRPRVAEAQIWKIGNMHQPSRVFSTGSIVACAEGAKDEFSRLMSAAMQRAAVVRQPGRSSNSNSSTLSKE